MVNFIERPRQRASINRILERDKCTLDDLLVRSLSEGRRTQVKKMIWERDRRNGEIVDKKRGQFLHKSEEVKKVW